MDCPNCQVWMEGSECPSCGYRNFALNVADGHVAEGNVMVGACERMYCVEKQENETHFCPHLEKMCHNKDPRKLTIFCNPVAYEGVQ